jgi:hypothetical protein
VIESQQLWTQQELFDARNFKAGVSVSPAVKWKGDVGNRKY